MRSIAWQTQAACVLGMGMLSGCATITPSDLSAPFLIADAADTRLIQALAHEQDRRVEKCGERKSCQQDHFTRGLIALFESRDAAVDSFQRAMAVAPNSRLALTSASWIELLRQSGGSFSFFDKQSAEVPKVTVELVWDSLGREFEGSSDDTIRLLFSDRDKRVEGLTSRRQPFRAQEQATIQTLVRELSERDQKIAELTRQLDALKRIEEESANRRKPLRPSAGTVAP